MNDPLPGSKILLIDDDPDILELLEMIFSRTGAQLATALTSAVGLREFYAFRPDLVLLDLMMPDMSGWEVCTRLRELSDVPIIMLTALDQPESVTRGLESGADDYVTKPFDKQILLARVRALLRRSAPTEALVEPLVYDDGHLSLNLPLRQVRVRQRPVQLTPTEYRLLAYLVPRPGRVLTYQQILEHVWGPECRGSIQYVHVYLHRLRQKLEPNPQRPCYLLTEPGVGLRFEPQSLPQA
jgi:two-component system KDP operon response regulator KdpE